MEYFSMECRIWKSGMTALNIAVVRNDVECIRVLEPLVGSRTEFVVMTLGKYLCDLWGFSAVEEVEEKQKRKREAEAKIWR